MNDWLAGSEAPSVLVTVAAVEGSCPREPGARMRVEAAHAFDTIGGGHLEQRAIETARAMLADGRARHVERFALGPTLGQCCGGVAFLVFERFGAAQREALQARPLEDTWRFCAFDGAADWALLDAGGALVAGTAQPPAFAREPRTRIVQEPDGRRWLLDYVAAPRAHLFLFGAGHVGQALVRALAPLPCRVTWVDERAEMFPAAPPANVAVEATDTPEAVVQAAAPGASFLVMTHSHALDQRLAAAILARGDAGWFGLIGSRTKRARFERRLREHGIAQASIDAMVCPIGLPGIAGKHPAVIAASVCAQLLAAWEAQACARAGEAPLRLVASRRH